MKIILLIGASGSGKTTIGRKLEEIGIEQLVSFTTRSMRDGEVDGLDYHFVSPTDLKTLDIVETTEYDGNHYGLTRQEVDSKLTGEKTVYFITNADGAQQVSDMYPEITTCFWLSISPRVMSNRMIVRGDNWSAVEQRVEHAESNEELYMPAVADIGLNAEWSVGKLVDTIVMLVNNKYEKVEDGLQWG